VSVWDAQRLVEIVADGLADASRRSRLEQAVRGIDACSEVDLHPLLAASLEQAGFGVLREHPYPGDVARRRKRPERERCDLVLTAQCGLGVADPVAELLQKDRAAGTLFEHAAAEPDRAGLTAPEDAFWMEVKAVGQFTYTQGVPGPNAAYSSELTGALTMDLAKLSREPAVRWGGLLLVMFTDEQRTAEHDLNVALHRALDKGVQMRPPRSAGFEIPDRIGNRWCEVALAPSWPRVEAGA